MGPFLDYRICERVEHSVREEAETVGWIAIAVPMGSSIAPKFEGGVMRRNLLLTMAMSGCVSCLLFVTVTQGHAESVILSGDVARGKTLFVRNCAGCHGREGGGDGYRMLGPDPANLTLPSTSKKSDTELLQTIHGGKPNMPAWKGNFSEKQTRDVLAYVRSLGK